MIRDEALAWLLRRRIYALPAGIVALGVLGLAWGTGPLFRAVCGLVVVVGAAVFVAFRQHEALRREGAAPGVVEVDEARIAYLAAQGGQVVDRDGLRSVELEIRAGAAEWVLTHEGGPPLSVPLAAAGAEALSGLIEALPGAELGAARAALEADTTGRWRVWTRARDRIR